MGAMLRSDPMVLCHMYLQPETAFDVISELGEMSCVEFIDLNSNAQAFTRSFIKEVCRCAEMERQLRYIHGEMLKDDIPIADTEGPAHAMLTSEMRFHENLFEKWEHDISAVSENLTTIMKTYMELKELEYVLEYIGPILGNADIMMHPSFKATGDQMGRAAQLVVTTGVVLRKRCFSFEMMQWRVARGNIFYRQASDDKVFEDPYTGEEIRKVAFLSVCQGTQLGYRLEKVYTGFGTTLYHCPETLAEREAMLLRVSERLWDMEQVISNSKYLRCKALLTVGKNWRKWMAQVRKAKAIYHTFGYCYKDITKECLIGKCWIPEADIPRVNQLLARSTEKSESNVPSFLSKVGTQLKPPTFQRTNKFTNGFQVLINSYGTSQYRELNPGLYTIITFPFLFAMMFGDAGHAVILILTASWMIRNESKYMGKPTSNEIWKIFFGGRYIILFLGLFSINAGLVYNDWFGKAIGHVTSYWKCFNVTEKLAGELQYHDIDPSGKLRNPYPFGLDPIWSISSNKILMQNSIKMKLSIIIGVIHMLFGLSLSLVNYLHFKQRYRIILQFIPEALFLCCFFMWLVILMYYKWFKYSGQHPDITHRPPCAPQILLLFIDMVLVSESKPPAERCLAYMFENQRMVQNILLLIGLLCIPVLLTGTPTFIYFRDYRGKGTSTDKGKGPNASTTPTQFRRYQKGSEDEAQEKSDQHSEEHGEHGEHEPFSEILIHQAIHTIEFVLSTISHTASYLRLWALSLAHSQLSDMLWEMVLSKLALQDTSWVGIPRLFVIFSMWAFFTLSILVLMEGLSAFLHTLRLHWVEFMSKFYNGGGIQFTPLSFRALLETDSDKMDAGCKKIGARED